MINCKYYKLLILIFCIYFGIFTCKDVYANDKNPFDNLARAITAGRFVAWQDIKTVKDLAIWYAALNTKQVIDYKALQALLIRHPNWPSMFSIRKLVEQKMPAYLHPEQIESWYLRFPPVTGEGLRLYMQALTTMRKLDTASNVLKKHWTKIKLTNKETKHFTKRYGHILTDKDHRDRADYLFWKGRLEETTYIYDSLADGDLALVRARIKLARVEDGVDEAIRSIPSSMINDSSLQYARLYWRRKKDMDMRAAELLSPDTMPKNLIEPAKWWRERHILARRAMQDKNFKQAYILASGHKQKGSFAFAQAEFLSGFLALRFLDQPRQAFDHFYDLYNNVKTPVSLARASYWLGRAAEQMNDKQVSRKWYMEASNYPSTFYGQHAVEKLGDIDIKPVLINQEPLIDTKQFNKFTQDKNMRMLHFLHLAGLDKYARPFFTRAISRAKTTSDYMAIIDLGRKTGQYHYNVFASKKLLSKKKISLFNKGYPVLPSHWRSNSNSPDQALVHALIRQESNFETTAKSPAGAMGLMQLMPATAQETRISMKIPRPSTGKKALTSNPTYNIRLGSKYLQNMLGKYDGSAVLAIAAYNAGPGRVNTWLKELGDPRKISNKEKHDDQMIDWIEQIPIYETRNYVQRVLENRFVYTYRLEPETRYVRLSSLF